MRILFTIVILIFAATICLGQTAVMTFNIRYNNPQDGENWWENRKGEVVDLLHYYQPDFMGLQEVLPAQLDYVSEQLEGYEFIGVNRDGAGTNSEGAPIFYKKDRYELLACETIWLSETPDTISRGWDAALNRILVYGKFKNKATNEVIHVFNAHFDHRGEIARLKSAELIVNYIDKIESVEPIVLMGDFNSEPDNKPIQTLAQILNDTYETSINPAYGPVGTFNGFDTEESVKRRIDYIFTKNVEVMSYRCIDDRRQNNLHVSDHLPVMIEF